jgi:crossover junction endodeoxyribonuclease RuvC
MKVMALDVSTKTGLALFHDPVTFTTEVINAPKKECRIQRASLYRDAVAKKVSDFKPDLCVLEGYGFNNANTLVTLVEIGTMIRSALVDASVPMLEIPPLSLKKFVTGQGNVKKEVIIKEVFKRWGAEFDSNDEADAFSLGKMVYCLAGHDVGIPKAHITKAMEEYRKIILNLSSKNY